MKAALFFFLRVNHNTVYVVKINIRTAMLHLSIIIRYCLPNVFTNIRVTITVKYSDSLLN
jgi:hypothetical protein